jgi:hypothetical protein
MAIICVNIVELTAVVVLKIRGFSAPVNPFQGFFWNLADDGFQSLSGHSSPGERPLSRSGGGQERSVGVKLVQIAGTERLRSELRSS